MWSMHGQEFERISEEKGGPLSEKNCLGVPYCKKGLVSIVILSEVLELTLYMKGIFTKWVSDEEVVLTITGEIVCG